MNSLHYYAQRKSTKNGIAQTPVNRYGTAKEMERQFHLFCASACVNADEFEVDVMEWGTLEHGVTESKVYLNDAEPEPTPEPELVEE